MPDRFTQLAKEKGYRARAAFKLIQLNRKYGFLEKSKVLLDLCAAPGVSTLQTCHTFLHAYENSQSWCQVAAETMPTNSLIVGVDLAPIKPIPHTITFQSDITTDKCRATIRQHLKSWKADTVLHDGAPNVGIAWVQDAFSQAELTLQALKLATDFLAEGGTFVTKVFRSKDYNALLWVLNQLFCKVEATKPPSSRNVSAEIFVVCRAFKAPKRIDPRLLDPRSVFAELTNATPNNEAKVFNPEKKKRKREGYDEGDCIQFKEISASAFVQSTDPIALLGTYNRFTLDQDADGDIASTALARLAETTDEIRDCCSDLRVLGRKEFRILLRWRLKAREVFGLRTRKGAETPKLGEEVAEVIPMSEEMRIQEELHGMQAKETSRRKRERRRENEKKQKDTVRMQLHMLAPTDIGLEQTGPFGEGAMFNLNTLNRSGMVEHVARGSVGPPMSQDLHKSTDVESWELSDDLEDHLDGQLDALYDRYRQRKIQNSAKYRALRARKEEGDELWQGLSSDEEVHGATADMDVGLDEQSSADEDFPDRLQRSSLEDSQLPRTGLSHRTAMFFDQDIFKGIEGLDTVEDRDSAIDLDSDSSAHQGVKAKADVAQSGENQGAVETCDASAAELDQIRSAAKGIPSSHAEISENHSLASPPLERRTSNDDAFEIVKLDGHVDERRPGMEKATGPLGMSSQPTSTELRH